MTDDLIFVIGVLSSATTIVAIIIATSILLEELFKLKKCNKRIELKIDSFYNLYFNGGGTDEKRS